MIEYTVRVYDSGTKWWFLNNKLHREDGPALEWASGSKCWYLNGERHREDGPACEWSDGSKAWYLNGKNITEQEHKKAMAKTTCEGKEVVVDGITYVLKEKQK